MPRNMLILTLLGLAGFGDSQTVLLKCRLRTITDNGVCQETQEVIESIREDVSTIIKTYTELLQQRIRPCDCGGPGWRRVAYLNMSNTTESCPGDWELVTTPKRSCARPANAPGRTCYSAYFQSSSYSQVCGRILGYQFGFVAAFLLESKGQPQTINGAYVSGVSLTYGNARQHIWTFAAALDNIEDRNSCPCTDINREADITIPSYVGNDYFCETGVPTGQSWRRIFYPDTPLWDGEGCGPTSACCTFNNPPWFCKHLPQPTNDDLEIRLCGTGPGNHDNTHIELVEIYSK